MIATLGDGDDQKSRTLGIGDPFDADEQSLGAMGKLLGASQADVEALILGVPGLDGPGGVGGNVGGGGGSPGNRPVYNRRPY